MDLARLADLDQASLYRLATLLEVGLLTPPYGDLILRDYVSENHAVGISSLLSSLNVQGLPPAHIALTLRAFAAGRDVNRDVSESVDVVVSGPDVTLASRDTGVVVRQLFSRARNRVLAVGFAVHQGRSIFQLLADRLDACSNLEATLCVDVRRPLNSTSMDVQIVREFTRNFVENEWPGTRMPRLYYDPRSVKLLGTARSSLHAKCVIVDGSESLVTSANFTEAAQTHNIELGLLVNSCAISSRIEGHFQSLISNGILERLPLS